MGSFDMAKCVRCCIERYVSGGGIEDAFIETKVLGKKMAEQFLNRTHYARSLRAISVSTNAINRQKWETFWERYDINEYKDLLPYHCCRLFMKTRQFGHQSHVTKHSISLKKNVQNFRTIF